MKKYLATLTALLLIVSSSLFALNRDYKSDCDEDNSYQSYYYPYCPRHAPDGYPDWLPSSLVKFIPATGPECRKCYDRSIYLGYVDPDFKKYCSHLEQQLEHCSQHTNCNCYWPEYSLEAAQISDSAYLLFRDLISTTALSNLLDNENEQRSFIDNPGWFLNKHGLTISFIAQQFRFSDYYHVYKDIANYATANYEEREAAKIKDKLDDILEALYRKFYALHTACYAKHPSPDIEQEIRLMKLLVGDVSGLDKKMTSANISMDRYNQQSYDASELIISNLKTVELPVEIENKGFKTKKAKNKSSDAFRGFEYSINADIPLSANASPTLGSFSAQSEVLLEHGTVLNDLLLYKEAINVLTGAIRLNPSNRNAYIERATAYFETNQLPLALKDYEQAKKLTIVPPFKPGSQRTMMMAAIYIPESKTEFSKGLVFGTVEGAKVSAKEFFPSVLSCCRGILNGLWAFALSPVEVSQEMLNTAYAIGEFIASHSTSECLECVVPELRDLSLTWEKINDYLRGQKIGYIIGKYGVDIFAPVGAIKGANKIRNLKRANTMCTLEGCTASQAKQAKILEESAKLAAQRELIINQATKSNKILVRTKNVCPHVMQDHHHWEKVIKLTGNKEEDFKVVLKLIEDNKIVQKANIKDTFIHRDVPISVIEYGMDVNGHEVRVFMEHYIEKGEIFLKNAYVQTPK